MFEVSSLESPTCRPIQGAKIWVDFDDEKAKGLLRKLPKGMGTVLAIFVGKVEAGKAFGPNDEQVRLIIDKIEKVEQRKRPKADQRPDWIPQNCLRRKQR